MPRDRIRAKAWRQAKIVENTEKVLEYLSSHPCVDCGEDDPIILEFDHVRGKKKYAVAALVAGGWAWRTIRKEIGKCDVRCCNCHRKRTYKLLNISRLKFLATASL